ncbi:MAG: hypothetical protein P9L88_00810 [Candidatus Tantalella remota]|nr:hypothetical protein [Candidatus Tantalella remota]
MNKNTHFNKGIGVLIGTIEVVFGFLTLIASTIVQFGHFSEFSPKPVNVYVFVTLSSLAGVVLGAGLLKGKAWARILLVCFAGYVILTKILVYSGLLSFGGTMLTVIPSGAKDAISLLYHSAIVIFLSRRSHR